MKSSENTVARAEIARAVVELVKGGELGMLATVIEGPAVPGSKVLFNDSARQLGSTGSNELDMALESLLPHFLSSRSEAKTVTSADLNIEASDLKQYRVLLERIEPEPRLVICGAGHVGAALARLAGVLGYKTVLIDDRPNFVSREISGFDGIELVAAEDWTSAVHLHVGNGRGVAVAVVTRGHNEDEECLRAVLDCSPDYVGLIGSKRRTNIVLGRLKESGCEEEQLREVRAPIGLDIGAVSPQEVALAILAEIVAERRGGSGGPMSAWRRVIQTHRS
jgi:xanthine dehydrogenase accessory factor